ncbi:MAG: DUF1853 family protein [Flavobacteriaceae bacterium]
MTNLTTETELQYLGYLQTPQLWETDSLLSLVQLHLPPYKHEKFVAVIDKKLRLGHLVEYFVFHELEQDTDTKLLATNIQVKNKLQTIGELDCILKKGNTYIHLEIVYKFYLYDETVGYSELEHWIGPNRKDALIEKITKLKQKQLPLLYKPETKSSLDELDLKATELVQQVCFKAQLFVPYHVVNMPLRLVNNACISGYYINYNNLNHLRNHLFYVPKKLDWLVQPHNSVDWLSFEDAYQVILGYITEKKSPLCWVKSPQNVLQKLFVVWW